MKEILLLMGKLDSIWHYELECCGNYHVGNRKKDTEICFLMYNRVVQVANHYGWDIRDDWTPEYVTRNTDEIYDLLVEAIYCINKCNGERTPYGTDLIPQLPSFNFEEKKIINVILYKWFEATNNTLFSMELLNEAEWAEFIISVRTA